MPNPTRTVLAALLMTVGLAGFATAQPYPGIPVLRQERIPPPPHGPRMVWEPGHWQWTGNSYSWIGGHYVRPGRSNAQWVHGHWANQGGRQVWVPAHWR